jgi:hypothetical protein
VVVLRKADGVEVASRAVPLERSGNTGYADLGPAVGPESLLIRLLAQAALPLDEVELRLVVTDD